MYLFGANQYFPKETNKHKLSQPLEIWKTRKVHEAICFQSIYILSKTAWQRDGSIFGERKNKNLRKPMKPVLGRLTRKRRFTLQESLCSGASAPSTPALQFIPFYLLSAPLPRGGYCLPCLLQIALLCLIYLSVDIQIKIQLQINWVGRSTTLPPKPTTKQNSCCVGFQHIVSYTGRQF